MVSRVFSWLFTPVLFAVAAFVGAGGPAFGQSGGAAAGHASPEQVALPPGTSDHPIFQLEGIARIAFEFESDVPEKNAVLMKYFDWDHFSAAVPQGIRGAGVLRSGVDVDYLKSADAYSHLPAYFRQTLNPSGHASAEEIQTRWMALPSEKRAALVDVHFLSDLDKAKLSSKLPLHEGSPPLQLRDVLHIRADAPPEMRNLEVEYDLSVKSSLRSRTPLRGGGEMESEPWLGNLQK